MTIAKDKVASIDYTLTNDTGETLDSSTGREPLSYIQGYQNIIPGLEKELEGKSVGDKFKISIPPEEAYGKFQESLIQEVPKTAFQGVEKIDVGMQFQAQMEGGPVVVTVTKVEEEKVTIDGNHPLADMTLTFDVEVKEIRDASEEELEHGHVHGPEGHQH
ncbi:MAG: peptidylprolyl isomerase [Bacteroidota bacterium]